LTVRQDERAKLLQTLDNKDPDDHYICEHSSSEITCLCPFSGNPDFYTILLQYEPQNKLVELKSLKLYLTSYRDERIIHEELLNRIFSHLRDTIEPQWMYIELIVNVRGGISTTVRRFYSAEEGGDNIEMAILKGQEG